jgi:uncharacterized protein involved in outer membrane biogenesis
VEPDRLITAGKPLVDQLCNGRLGAFLVRWKKAFIAAALLIVVLIGAAYAFLVFYDFNNLKPMLAQLVKDATGRELTIGGDIDIKLGLTPTLLAEGIRFQNAPWGSRSALAEVKQIQLRIALLPLLRGKFNFIQLVLLEPDVILEFNQAGKSNFRFGTARESEKDTTLPVLAFSDVRIEEGVLTYKNEPSDKTFRVGLERLQAVIPGLDKLVQLDFEGTLDDVFFTLQGTFGPIAAWIEPGHSLPVDLTAKAGGASFTVKGEARDPINFRDLSFRIHAEGPSAAEIARLSGVENVPELGGFKLAAKVADPEGKLALEELDIQVGSEQLAELRLTGAVRDLLAPRGIELDFSVRGNDAANMTKFGLPPPLARGAFSATGRIIDPEANIYAMRDLEVVLGDKTIGGRLQLNMAAESPYLTADLASPQFGLGPFTLAVKLIRPADKLAVEKLDLQIGSEKLARIRLRGAVDDLLGLEGVNLDFGFRGEDLANLKELTGRNLPVRGAFSGSGKVIIPVRRKLKIPELKVVVGNSNITGSLGLDLRGHKPRYSAVLSSQKLRLQRVLVPEFAELGWVKALDDLGPVELAVKLAGFAEELSVEKIELRAGTKRLAKLNLSGAINDLRAQRGIDLGFTVRGKNVANLKKFIGQPLPVAGEYALSGRITDSRAKIYRANNLEITLGENNLVGWLALNLAGQWPRMAAELSTQTFNLQPLSLSAATALANLRKVSDLGPLKLNIKVTKATGKLSIEQIDLHAGRDNLVEVDLSGAIGDVSNQRGLNLNFEVRGNEIANLEELVGHSLPVKGAYGASGHLTDPVAKNYKVNNLELSLADNQISGWVNLNLAQKQPQLTTELWAPHFNLKPVTLPGLESLRGIADLGHLKLGVKLTRSGERLAAENLNLNMGRTELVEVMLKGTVDDLLNLRGFELDFAARGKDLSDIKEVGFPEVPVQVPFSATGRVLDPAPRIYQFPSLEVFLGDNYALGSLGLNLTEKRPRVTAEMSSQEIDLRPLLARSDKETVTESKPTGSSPERDRVFSSEPWSLDKLRLIDADIKIRDKKVLLPNLALTDVMIDIMLKNGNLRVKPLKFTVGSGRAEGQLNILSQGKTPTVAMELRIDQFDIGAMLEDLGAQRTLDGTLDIDFRLSGQGNSTADFLAGSNGEIYLVMSDGRAASRYLDLLQRYLGSDVLRLLNPFQVRRASAPVNCFVGHIEITDGLADSKLLLDTDQSSIFSAGDVNLKTERLNFGITPVPKRGYGVRGAASVSFSFRRLSQPFRLGGTLANPSLALDSTRTAFVIGRFAGALALGPLGIPLFFSDISLGRRDPCPIAIEAVKEAIARRDQGLDPQRTPRRKSCLLW